MTLKELKKMNKAQLQEACASFEIVFEDKATKDELIDLLVKAGHVTEDVDSTEEAEEAEATEEKVEPKEVEKDPFEELQKDGFALIAKVKALATERRKQSKPTARLDNAVSQIERLIKNNFIK